HVLGRLDGPQEHGCEEREVGGERRHDLGRAFDRFAGADPHRGEHDRPHEQLADQQVAEGVHRDRLPGAPYDRGQTAGPGARCLGRSWRWWRELGGHRSSAASGITTGPPSPRIRAPSASRFISKSSYARPVWCTPPPPAPPPATTPAITSAAPARMSGARTGAADSRGTPRITAWCPSVLMSAPIRCNSPTYVKRPSKTFSVAMLVPSATES